MAKGENALVEWLQQRFSAHAARVVIGIGDDGAAVRCDGTLVMITADMLLDGVHFDTSEHGYEAIGRKAIACSLSDCAAMVCEPRVATVSVALAETMSLDEVKRLYEGMAGVADEFGCAIAGGDTTSWPSKLAIDVAMLAEPMCTRGPIRRNGARIGDTIYVSGPLGGSLIGRHLTFTPRLDLARRLAPEPDLHAIMDISDGLALDLHRLCTASACDAELFAEQLEQVVSDDARTCSETDARLALEHVLSDGEDFELLVVGGDGLAHDRFGLTAVGRIVPRRQPDQAAIVMCYPGKRREPIEPRGYQHFR